MIAATGGFGRGDTAVGSFRMAALALLVAAGVLGPAGSATAQRVVIDDGTADVWVSEPVDEYGSLGPFTQAGPVTNVDVVRTTVTYTRTELKVISEYVDLKKNGPDWPELDSWFKLSDGGGVLVRATAVVDGEEDAVSIYTDKTAQPGGRFQRGRCNDATATFDFRADTGTTVLPLSCVTGDSRWVKFHGGAMAIEEETDPKTLLTWLYIWEDNVTDDSYDQDAYNRSCFWECTGWTKVRRN